MIYEASLFKEIHAIIKFKQNIVPSSLDLDILMDPVKLGTYLKLYPEYKTVTDILKMYQTEYIADTTYGIDANIYEWYCYFLALCLRDKTHIVSPEKFSRVRMDKQTVYKIQTHTKNGIIWQDIRETYNLNNITNIIIGDNIYDIDDVGIDKSILFDNILRDTAISNVVIHDRFELMTRLSSNRYDIMLYFEEKKEQKYTTDIIYVSKVHYQDTNLTTAITPFYISLNKKIVDKQIYENNTIKGIIAKIAFPRKL
jgi:hypothetical protein